MLLKQVSFFFTVFNLHIYYQITFEIWAVGMVTDLEKGLVILVLIFIEISKNKLIEWNKFSLVSPTHIIASI